MAPPPTIGDLLYALIATPEASDGFLIAGAPPTIKAMRKLIPLGRAPLSADSISGLVEMGEVGITGITYEKQFGWSDCKGEKFI